MVRGKQWHSRCKTFFSRNPQDHGQSIKMKVQPHILEHADIACRMMRGLMSALGCGLGRGI